MQLELLDPTPSELDAPIVPYWQTTDEDSVKLYLGDVIQVLQRLPANSVHMVVTSPPYWALRDYGTAEWEGGNPKCKHEGKRKERRTREQYIASHDDNYDTAFINRYERNNNNDSSPVQFGSKCIKCGATRIDQQLGSEETPEEYVANMVKVFREVKRVLRDDGTCWLNIGDTYASSGVCGGSSLVGDRKYRETDKKRQSKMNRQNTGIDSGNICGIPWMLAFALRADGWILRQDIIWHKTNPMPESVENRCTKAHEYLFLLTKQTDYYFDQEAIRDKAIKEWNPAKSTLAKGFSPKNDHLEETGQRRTAGADTHHDNEMKNFANKRSVWSVPSQSYKGAHFATFPVRLITPCILAGTSEKGCCGTCGAQWERVIERTGVYYKDNEHVHTAKSENSQHGRVHKLSGATHKPSKRGTDNRQPTCACNGYFRIIEVQETVKKRVKKNTDEGGSKGRDHSQRNNRHGKDSVSLDRNAETETIIEWRKVRKYYPRIKLEDHPIVPCIVLDPFIGSGTTCEVSLAHQRRSIGIDLSREYLAYNAIPRIEGYLRSVPNLAHLAHKQETTTISFD